MLMLVLSAVLAGEVSGEAPSPEALEAHALELILAAKNLFAERRYAEAIDQFRASHALKARTSNLYNIGKCFERLHDSAMALRWYRAYVRAEPTGNDDPVVNRDIENARAALAAKGLQQLVVYVEPPGAQVLIDGRALTESPAYAELTDGTHRVTVTADGYESATRSFVVDPRQLGELTVALRLLDPPAPEGPGSPAEVAQPGNAYLDRGQALAQVGQFAGAIEELEVGRRVPGTPDAQRAALGLGDASQPRPRVERVPAWIAIAVAVAAGAAGTILQVQSRQLGLRASSHLPPYDWADTARNGRALAVTDATIATVLFATAGVAGTTGGVLFAW